MLVSVPPGGGRTAGSLPPGVPRTQPGDHVPLALRHGTDPDDGRGPHVRLLPTTGEYK